MYGHDNPGDGFTAGVIISLAVGLWYVVFGYEDTRRRLPWLRPYRFIASGILLALLVGTFTRWATGSFFGNYDIDTIIHLPLPRGFHISSSFLIELAICLSVLGSASYILDRLGHPDHTDFSGSLEHHADNSSHQR
jgi:multicomponent K+:H+ antiporter subunit A